MSGRGRASRSTPTTSFRSSRSASPSWSSGKRGSRGNSAGNRNKVRTPPSNRRPKFNDNPPAPEIVEKTDLSSVNAAAAAAAAAAATAASSNGMDHEETNEELADMGDMGDMGDILANNMRQLLQDKVEHVKKEDQEGLQDKHNKHNKHDKYENHPLLIHLKQRLQERPGTIPDLPSLKSAVSESLSQLGKGGDDDASSLSQMPTWLSNAIKELFMSHVKDGKARESVAEEGLSYLKSQFAETTVVPLDQLDHNMVPVESVQIQEFRVQGEPETLKKPSSLFDKSKLFSQMEDTFAKDTQQALKHKPVYTKKREQPLVPSPLENKENETLKNGPSPRDDSPSPPVLIPEMEVRSAASEPGPPLDDKYPSPLQTADLTFPHRKEGLLLHSRARNEETIMWPAVLSRTDAEMAAMALQLTLNKPSLKTVIRVPPSSNTNTNSNPNSNSTAGQQPHVQHAQHAATSSTIKKKKNSNRVTKVTPTLAQDDLPGEEDPPQEVSLVIDEDEEEVSPRSSPITPTNHLANSSSGKLSPDSHKSEEKVGPPESMVVPEKASSFNIHPERCCSDMCHYCGLKFGMLDTPLHVSQLKTSEVRKKVEDITGFEKDACLCDKCFRFLDRRAKNSKQGANDLSLNAANAAVEKKKKDESNRKEDRKCIVRNCNREVSENVSKKWLVRLKKKLVRKISLDWERVGRGSVKSVFPVCHKHHSWVDFYSSCGLCKKKLTVGGICTLGISKQEVHELNALLREDRIPAELVENHFVCKLCRTFCNIKQKSAISPDVFRNQKAQKGFCKDYKKRLYQCLRLDGGDTQDNDSEGGNSLSSSSNGGPKTPKKIHQVSQSDNPTKITIKTTTIPLDEEERPARKRRGGKEVFTGSPSSIKVTESSSCSVAISFDLNTKKLWQDMHFPYGNYTAFFRHLILLEKFWRNGDLKLSETASEKSSVYIKSVYNRIRAYEGGRSNVKKSSLSSDVDLSASTRPDLSIPAAPLFLHEPPEEEEEEQEDIKVKKDPPYKPPVKEKQPEILRIPKVPLPSRSGGNDEDGDELASPPTKIRVRTDLMHLGLTLVKPVPNLMNDKTSSVASSTSTITTTANTESSVVTTSPSVPNPIIAAGAKKMSPHTISSMLNDSPRTPPPSTSTNLVLNESPVAPVATTPSSDKSGSNQQSSAIPLTFNNSIAEVLEAANKATKQNAKESVVSMALASKPEITITAKPPLPKQQVTSSVAGSKAHPSWVHDKGPSKKTTSTRSPIVDMTKLLQTQNPGLPPHLVAQDQLNPGSQLKRPVPNARMVRPPPTSPSSSPVLVANQQKKSINNILDRLSGLKASSSPSQAKNVPPSSSLVQQLQAPPQHLPPSPPRMSGPQQQAAAAAAAAQQLMWAFNPMGAAGGGSSSSSNIVGQRMVQYDWLSQTQALMMAGALPTLDQVQAAQRAQAFQELMNLGMGNKNTGNARLRAPPPLTHMGKGSLPKTKND